VFSVLQSSRLERVDRLAVCYSGFLTAVFIRAVTWEHWLVNHIVFSTVDIGSQSKSVSGVDSKIKVRLFMATYCV